MNEGAGAQADGSGDGGRKAWIGSIITMEVLSVVSKYSQGICRLREVFGNKLTEELERRILAELCSATQYARRSTQGA